LNIKFFKTIVNLTTISCCS